MKYIVVSKDEYATEAIYFTSLTTNGEPQFVFNRTEASTFDKKPAEALAFLCNKLTRYFFIIYEAL